MTQAHPPGVQVAALPVGPDGPRCRCVKRHVPQPAEEEGHHPVPRGKPFEGDPGQELLWLCPTGHGSIHLLIRIYLRAREQNRSPTSAEVAHFSPFTRKWARVAMDALRAKDQQTG